MRHPILSLACLSQGIATTAFIATADAAQANPNLAALATIMGAVATIFSGWVAYRHPRRKSRLNRGRKPRGIPPRANQKSKP